MATFFFMVRFSSLHRDREVAVEKVSEQEAAEISDATAFREAADFLSANQPTVESDPVEAGASLTVGENTVVGINAPVSLADLIGGEKPQETTSDGNGGKSVEPLLIFNNQ